MTADRHVQLFPALATSDYEITSLADPAYNCIAWAAEDTARWWEPVPIPLPSYYWPEGVSLELTLASYVQAFESLGYRVCDDDSLESGFMKIGNLATAPRVACGEHVTAASVAQFPVLCRNGQTNCQMSGHRPGQTADSLFQLRIVAYH